MKSDLGGLPGDAQGLDDMVGAITRDARVLPLGCAPGLDACHTAGTIETPAVQQHNPGIIQLANLRQQANGMSEDSPIGGLVQHAPHGNGRMIPVRRIMPKTDSS